jgi:hypothetical protein
MLIGIALLPLVAQLLLLFFSARVGADLEALAGCGAMVGIGIGGAEGCSGVTSLVRQQHFQRQAPRAKMQLAALIIAAGEVNAQCASGTLS